MKVVPSTPAASAAPEGDTLIRGKSAKKRVGNLPNLRKCHEKIAQGWDVLQRKIARRSGAVEETHVEWPRLLEVAESVAPVSWNSKLENWPDVARAASRLRSPMRSIEPSGGMLLSDESKDSFDLAELLGESLSLELLGSVGPSHSTEMRSAPLTESKRQFIPAAGSPFGEIRTPPYARSPAPIMSPSPETACDAFSSRYLNSAMPSEVDLFGSQGPSPQPGSTTRSGLVEAAAQVEDQFLEKLDYVRSCRELLGPTRYTLERHRLEVQASAKDALKYDRPKVPTRPKSQKGGAYTGATRLQGQLATPSLRRGAAIKAALQAEEAAEASAADAAAVAAAFQEDADTFGARCRGSAESGAVWEGRAASEYSALCRQRKLAAPALGSFAIQSLKASAPRPPRKRPSLLQTAEGSALATPYLRTPAGSRRGSVTASSSSATSALPLRVGHWSLGDGPLVALAESSRLGEALEAAEYHLVRGNRLSCEGLKALAQRLGQKTVLIDLAENSFGSKGLNALVESVKRGSPCLRLLNLSRNRLCDSGVAALVYALNSQAPLLEQLSLSDVQLGAGTLSGQALGDLVQFYGQHLASLDVSFNMLQGSGALALVQGLHGNGARKGKLRLVDLAWNCLGRGEEYHSSIARELAQTFQECDVLFHLDISYNCLSTDDCTLLANGLAQNDSLWGLHVDGNAAIIDPDGFLIPVPESAPAPDAEQQAKDLKEYMKNAKRPSKKAKVAKTPAKSAQMRKPLIPTVAVSRLENKAGVGGTFKQLRRERAAREHAERLKLLKGTFRMPQSLRDLPLAGVPMPPFAQDSWLRILAHQSCAGARREYVGFDRCTNVHAASKAAGIRISADDDHTTSTVDDLRCRSCWLCGGWIEVGFVLSSESVDIPEGETCVRALCSLDNFSRPIVLVRDEASRTWSGSRFVPSTEESLIVIFQIGQRIAISKDMPRVTVLTPFQIKLPGATRNGGRAQALDASVAGDAATKQPADGLVTVAEVNLLHVPTLQRLRAKSKDSCRQAPDARTLEDVARELSRAKSRPRRLRGSALEDPLVHQVKWWTRADSLLAGHADIQDDSHMKHIDLSLESDWRLARTLFTRMWSQLELDRVYQTLKKHYFAIWSLYEHFSSFGRHEKDPGVPMKSFWQLLRDSGVPSAHSHLHAEVYDMAFAKCKRIPSFLEKDASVRSTDGLVRWQFLSALLEVAEICRRDEETFSVAVERLLREHFVPHGKPFMDEAVTFRSVAFTQAVDEVLRASLPALQAVFSFFSDGEKVTERVAQTKGGALEKESSDNANTMSIVEFMSFLSELQMIDERFGPVAHAAGRRVNVHEATTTSHYELHFEEFLLALVWIAYHLSGGSAGASELIQLLQDVMDKTGVAMSDISHWQGIPRTKEISVLRGWRVGLAWIEDMWSLLESIYASADHDESGTLSIDELSSALARDDVMESLRAMGMDMQHVATFFSIADRDGDGSLTPLEALYGFGVTKEILRRDEHALQILREVFDEPYDQNREVSWEEFAAAEADESLQAKMRSLQVDINFHELWDFVQQELRVRGADAPLDSEALQEDAAPVALPVTVSELMLCYPRFRDPARVSERCMSTLRRLIKKADVDDSGTLELHEFFAFLRDPEVLRVARAMVGEVGGPASADGAGDDEMPANVVALFDLVDDDNSGQLEIDEVLGWFQHANETVRMRELENRFPNGWKSREKEKGKRNSLRGLVQKVRMNLDFSSALVERRVSRG
eukprot:TRINITY_DN5075_c2_g2_i1.p1 TRINITY_DN5075_c2_g2~~TRINITY_DN5075_c2_g2_i1.p1  ORF type:complete len:1740 (-),score=266.24 TRINITY_DN5075_c2_g2_i1:80-5299(-)